MARHRNVDVLVVGAGPAGCAAAITLARAGVAATVLDTTPAEPPGIELAVPMTLTLLSDLGLGEWARSLPPETLCSGITLATQDTDRSTSLLFPSGPGRKLDRRELDRELKAAATRAGVEILPHLAAISPSFEGTRLTGILARGDDDREEILSCKVLVDASGRSAFLARRMGWGFPNPRHRRAAAWTVFSEAIQPAWVPADHLLLIALPEGYLWLLPLGDGRVSVGTVLPRRIWDDCAGSAERLLGKALGQCPPVDWLLARAKPERTTQAAPSLAFRVMDVAGHGYCLVGDAAGFLDPVLPHGLLTALLSGRSAGLDAADALLHRGRVTAVDFGPTISLVRLLQRQQLTQAQAFYDRDFLAVLLAGQEHLGARRALLELLEGDFLPPRRWRKLARAGMLAALAELQHLTRRLGVPLFPTLP